MTDAREDFRRLVEDGYEAEARRAEEECDSPFALGFPVTIAMYSHRARHGIGDCECLQSQDDDALAESGENEEEK